jgi:release factor glutamine methyltransferase
MKTYFMDFELETEHVTLAPRPETELLVEKAIALVAERAGTRGTYHILDVGTGCGNIAISMAKYLPMSIIVASDISDSALRAARGNARRYGVDGRITFVKSDLFKGIPEDRKTGFDLIVSNPPYVARPDLRTLADAVKDEPYIALDGGEDGLIFYRAIAKESPAYLKADGTLFCEVGFNQAGDVKGILKDQGGFRDIEVFMDYAGIERIIRAGR